MFIVDLNRESFEYDVQALVKAFYPEEQVQVLTPATREDRRRELAPKARLRIEIQDDMAEFVMDGEHSFFDPKEERASLAFLESREPGKWDEVIQETRAEGEWDEVMQETRAEGEWDEVMQETRAQDEWDAVMQEIWGRGFKDGFKRYLFTLLHRTTGKLLPWGNLTGIRPTKIAYGMLEQGKSNQFILNYYKHCHYVSSRKAELALEIAKRERELLTRIHYQGGYSLYIGIPFCPTTCLYCSFTSFPIAGYRDLVDKYLDCLIREMELTAHFMQGRILDCVYIGGGTPTTLEPVQLDRLLTKLREFFDFSTVQEFTVEAGRADSITEDKLKVLYDHGVSRISVNPQTMKQQTLDIIGRRASVEQVEQVYSLARKVGFDNINMDLILGLPGEQEADVRRTIDRVVEMGPDSLTVHSLAIKRASKLNQWIQENGVAMLHNTDETMEIAAEGAKRLGLVPYYLYRQKNMSGNFENVGYAREGKLGLYNILIIEEVQTIVALGAGSISKRVYPDGRIERCENVKEVAQYIERIGEMIGRKKVLLGNF